MANFEETFQQLKKELCYQTKRKEEIGFKIDKIDVSDIIIYMN